jgi:hypothetical protein
VKERPASGVRRPGARRGRPPAKEVGWAYLNLAVLWTFAVAQPLFDLLKDNPEFFAARGSTGFDIVSFSVLLVVLPPAVLLLVELLVGVAGSGPRRWVHLALIGVLVALVAAQALKKSLDASDAVLIVLSDAIGAGVAVLYGRVELVRSFLRALSPAPLVFLALFLFTDPISKLAFPEEAGARTIGGVTRSSIVVVQLDELPAATLMDDRGRIDRERYPGFAELARDATWFRNATTVYDSSERAQPAIMDGNLPREDRLPTSADHPNSIFSLFAKTHRLHVSDESTSVCSPELCENERGQDGYVDRLKSMTDDLSLVWLHVVSPPKLEARLPSVSETWGDFGGGDDDQRVAARPRSERARTTLRNLSGGRQIRFEDWIAGIRAGRRPQLALKQSLLPHVPWQYLSDGRHYRDQAPELIPGLSNLVYRDQGQLDVTLQRHYLQAGFADLELQHLWRRLKQQGLWDNALIVVTADHGIAFQRGVFRHRRLTRDTMGEIANVPLLIKAPGQNKGRISDSFVETVDVLPTILDLLNLDPRVEMDGRSAFSREVRRRGGIRWFVRNEFDEVRVPGDEFLRARRRVVERNTRLLGTGREGPDRLYRIGPHQELIGQPAGAAGPPLDVELLNGSDYDQVDLKSSYLPIHVVGKVRSPGEPPRDVAVAVNGTIRAVGNTFELASGAEGELVSVLVPPESLRQGRNRIQILAASAVG